MPSHFNSFETREQVARAAADYIIGQIHTLLKSQPKCHIALPGGETPALCLQYIAESDIPWDNIEWYLGDERCLPEGDQARNDTMIKQVLFSGHAPHARSFHPVEAELGAEQAARLYSKEIDAFDVLDLAILGMGEDGHTASLFPGNDALNDNSQSAIPVHDSPKPPCDRVSLSLKTLSEAKQRIIIAMGENKKSAIQSTLSGDKLPISLIGESQWFVDNNAYH